MAEVGGPWEGRRKRRHEDPPRFGNLGLFREPFPLLLCFLFREDLPDGKLILAFYALRLSQLFIFSLGAGVQRVRVGAVYEEIEALSRG